MRRTALSFAAAALVLAGCASNGDVRTRDNKVAEFDVPRPLLKVYLSEIQMLKTCMVGPVSKLFDIAIDPTFDQTQGTASIALVGTGMVSPQIWGALDLAAKGDFTHVRVYAQRRDGLDHLGRDAERWANAAGGC